MAADLLALLNNAIGGAKVFVNYFSHNRPASRILRPLALVFKVLKYAFAVLLDRDDISQESVTLSGNDTGRELPSWWWRSCRWIKGIEHGVTVGFVERFQSHFVYQSLLAILLVYPRQLLVALLPIVEDR